MVSPKLHSYRCAYDFDVEGNDFVWEEDGDAFNEYFPKRAAEAFVEWRAEIDGYDPTTSCVVVLDRETGEITRWDVEVETTYTARPVKE